MSPSSTDAAQRARPKIQAPDSVEEKPRKVAQSMFSSMSLGQGPRTVVRRFGVSAWDALRMLTEAIPHWLEDARREAYARGRRDSILGQLRPAI